MNFRIDGDSTSTQIQKSITDGKLADLYAKDQLVKVKKEGLAFTQLDEIKQPEFAPTYKFKPESSEYDDEYVKEFPDFWKLQKKKTLDFSAVVQPGAIESSPKSQFTSSKCIKIHTKAIRVT